MLPLADIWARLDERLNALRRLPGDLDVTRRALGRLLATRSRALGPASPLHEAEFSIYSQWGDDGIIQFLLQHVAIPFPERTFVEFGVEDYSEGNTRFLLVNDNWRGLVMDGSEAYVARIKQDPISWRHDLTAISAFVDTENINALLREHGVTGQIGLLHIDMDGIDYWVWQAISVVDPIIVIVEYNAVFGSNHAITVPYDPKFQRTKAHHSSLYWGASLKAFVKLGLSKGYAFVGCNSNGNNVYFIRRDRLGSVPAASLAAGFVDSRFRELRNTAGALTFVSGEARLALIADMPVVDVDSGRTVPIRSLSNHALEHCEFPLGELRKLLPKVKPGGKVVFVVPCEHISYLYRRPDINGHLYSWSPMNLANLFECAGFEIEECRPYFHKWPPFHQQIARVAGKRLFNVIARAYSRMSAPGTRCVWLPGDRCNGRAPESTRAFPRSFLHHVGLGVHSLNEAADALSGLRPGCGRRERAHRRLLARRGWPHDRARGAMQAEVA